MDNKHKNSYIRRALLSSFDKTHLRTLAQELASRGVELISTGGTALALRSWGLSVQDVESVTGFPEIMEGRVKTLHPKIHGALLGHPQRHGEDIRAHNIIPIDLVYITLYPFEETSHQSVDPDKVIEMIDIGGPSMLRSAAKNYQEKIVLSAEEDVVLFLSYWTKDEPVPSNARRHFAQKVFELTSRYDQGIAHWLKSQDTNASPTKHKKTPKNLHIEGEQRLALRYGENNHQNAALYSSDVNACEGTLSEASLLQGKALSYNNLVDAEAAWDLLGEFCMPGGPTQPSTAVIIKHAMPCGVSQGSSTLDAYKKARACDPLSSFGGIVAFNDRLNEETAQMVLEIFTEVVMARDFSPEALKILSSKPSLRVLKLPLRLYKENVWDLRSIAGGFLLQEHDTANLHKAQLKCVTTRHPTPEETVDLLFAARIAKHAHSNAIVCAKNAQALGIGAGQTSRIDATRIAFEKAGKNFNLQNFSNIVMASDGFFPFPDCIHEAAKNGCSAILQPGGSIRDNACIEAANSLNISMVFSGIRQFKH